MEETHFVGCVVQKSEGAVAYLVHRASSFVPEIPKLPASERLVWSFAEVYAPFVLTFLPSVSLSVQVRVRLEVRERSWNETD